MFKYLIEYRGGKTGMWKVCVTSIVWDTLEQAELLKAIYMRDEPQWEWRVSKWQFVEEVK